MLDATGGGARRTCHRRSAASAATSWSERAGARQWRWSARHPVAPDQPSADLGAAGIDRAGAVGRQGHRWSGCSRGGGAQQPDRSCSGVPGQPRHRGPLGDGAGKCGGAARWPARQHLRGGTCARRCGAAGFGRQSPGRFALAGRKKPPRRGGGPDRRVGSGGKVGGSGSGRCRHRRPKPHGVCRHPRGLRHRDRPCGGHGEPNRTRTHLHAAAAGHPAGDATDPGACDHRQVHHRRHRGDVGCDAHHRTGACGLRRGGVCRCRPGDTGFCHCTGRWRDTRGIASHCHDRAGHRRSAHGRAAGDHPQAAGG